MSRINKEETYTYNKYYYEVNRRKILAQHRELSRQLKLEALSHYSLSGIVKCSCCNVDDIDVLCLDHIDNNGNEHRKRINSYGTGFYRRLKKSGFPNGFQTLCFNCNMKKAIGKSNNDWEERNGNLS